MLKKLTVIVIILIIVFSLVACATDGKPLPEPEVKLSKLQADSIAELEQYALAEKMDSVENQTYLSGWLAEATESIATAEDTETITYDVMRVKAYIDWINAGKPVVEGLIGLGTVEGLSPERELAIIKKLFGENFKGQEDLDDALLRGRSRTGIRHYLGTVKGYLAVELIPPGWNFGAPPYPYDINGVTFVGYHGILFYDDDNNRLPGLTDENNNDGLWYSKGYYFDSLSREDIEQVREWHKLCQPDYYEDRILEMSSYSATTINSFLSDCTYGPSIIARTKNELIDFYAWLYCFNDDPSAYADEDDYNKKYNNEACKKIRSYDDDFFKDNALVLCGVNIYAKEEIPIILKSIRVYACRLYLNIDCPEFEEVLPKMNKHQYLFVLEIPKAEVENCSSVWTEVRQNGTMEDYPPYDEVIDIDVNKAE